MATCADSVRPIPGLEPSLCNELPADASIMRRIFYWGFIPSAVVIFYVTQSIWTIIAAVIIAERIYPRDPSFNVSIGKQTWKRGVIQLGKDSLWQVLLRVDDFAIAALVTIESSIIDRVRVQYGIQILPASWPTPLRIALFAFLVECAAYWPHRLAHNWKPLWSVHVVHHSVRRLTWLSGSARFHPIELVLFNVIQSGVLVASGATSQEFFWVMSLNAVAGVIVHANICVAAPVLNWVFVDPYHHWIHHSQDMGDSRTNYCCFIILVDRLFGTYRDHPKDLTLGIKGHEPPGIIAELFLPLVRTVAPNYLRANPIAPDVQDRLSQ